MNINETIKDEYFISTDKIKLDVAFIQNYLSNESYWAKNIPVETLQKSIDGSFCFGLFVNKNTAGIKSGTKNFQQTPPTGRQVGFARVITDHATFAYLADVFIIEEFRGKGLAGWLMKEIMDHPGLQGLRRWMLATKDAHGLYTKFGFAALDKPESIMGFKSFEEYPKSNS